MKRDVLGYVKKPLILGFVLLNSFMVVRSNRNAAALRDNGALLWVEQWLNAYRHASRPVGGYLSTMRT